MTLINKSNIQDFINEIKAGKFSGNYIKPGEVYCFEDELFDADTGDLKQLVAALKRAACKGQFFHIDNDLLREALHNDAKNQHLKLSTSNSTYIDPFFDAVNLLYRTYPTFRDREMEISVTQYVSTDIERKTASKTAVEKQFKRLRNWELALHMRCDLQNEPTITNELAFAWWQFASVSKQENTLQNAARGVVCYQHAKKLLNTNNLEFNELVTHLNIQIKVFAEYFQTNSDIENISSNSEIADNELQNQTLALASFQYFGITNVETTVPTLQQLTFAATLPKEAVKTLELAWSALQPTSKDAQTALMNVVSRCQENALKNIPLGDLSGLKSKFSEECPVSRLSRCLVAMYMPGTIPEIAAVMLLFTKITTLDEFLKVLDSSKNDSDSGYSQKILLAATLYCLDQDIPSIYLLTFLQKLSEKQKKLINPETLGLNDKKFVKEYQRLFYSKMDGLNPEKFYILDYNLFKDDMDLKINIAHNVSQKTVFHVIKSLSDLTFGQFKDFLGDATPNQSNIICNVFKQCMLDDLLKSSNLQTISAKHLGKIANFICKTEDEYQEFFKELDAVQIEDQEVATRGKSKIISQLFSEVLDHMKSLKNNRYLSRDFEMTQDQFDNLWRSLMKPEKKLSLDECSKIRNIFADNNFKLLEAIAALSRAPESIYICKISESSLLTSSGDIFCSLDKLIIIFSQYLVSQDDRVAAIKAYENSNLLPTLFAALLCVSQENNNLDELWKILPKSEKKNIKQYLLGLDTKSNFIKTSTKHGLYVTAEKSAKNALWVVNNLIGDDEFQPCIYNKSKENNNLLNVILFSKFASKVYSQHFKKDIADDKAEDFECAYLNKVWNWIENDEQCKAQFINCFTSDECKSLNAALKEMSADSKWMKATWLVNMVLLDNASKEAAMKGSGYMALVIAAANNYNYLTKDNWYVNEYNQQYSISTYECYEPNDFYLTFIKPALEENLVPHYIIGLLNLGQPLIIDDIAQYIGPQDIASIMRCLDLDDTLKVRAFTTLFKSNQFINNQKVYDLVKFCVKRAEYPAINRFILPDITDYSPIINCYQKIIKILYDSASNKAVCMAIILAVHYEQIEGFCIARNEKIDLEKTKSSWSFGSFVQGIWGRNDKRYYEPLALKNLQFLRTYYADTIIENSENTNLNNLRDTTMYPWMKFIEKHQPTNYPTRDPQKSAGELIDEEQNKSSNFLCGN